MENNNDIELLNFKIEPPKPKIYQYEGKRIAIRLEPPFLRFIDDLAKEYHLKSNSLVNYLYQNNKSKNFSSFLRSFLMAEAERRLLLSNASEYSKKFDFFMRTAPIPGILLSQDQTILHANTAFFKWTGIENDTIRERRFPEFFYVRTRNFSLIESINRVKYGHLEQFEIDLTFNPTQDSRYQLEAKALFCGYSDAEQKQVSFIVWFKTTASERPARVIKLTRRNTE